MVISIDQNLSDPLIEKESNIIKKQVWRQPVLWWLPVAVFSILLLIIFWDGLSLMVQWWNGKEEYSHGFMVPLISLFLIWQRKDTLEQVRFTGSWLGCLVILFGLLVYVIGEFSALYTIIQYGFLITLYGLFLAAMGWQAFKHVWVPLLILFFMIPLPNFIYNNLSAELQLISSQLGVWFIRLFGISVFLEGNVIDLGAMKLQVVEACSGLRYLFPLMTLGFILAYFYKVELWKRIFVFFSAIPVTIVMNSFRIGFIGYTVEFFGKSAAEGFLHDFEGWTVFMSSFMILVIEAWLLTHIGQSKGKPFREVFGLEFPADTPKNAKFLDRSMSKPFYLGGAFLAVIAFVSILLPERSESVPLRANFNSYPLKIGNWYGRTDILEKHFLDELKLSDYLMVNYSNPQGKRINLYSAYYESQRKGASAHSPRSCLPGGGWRIKNMEQRELTVSSQEKLSYNRVLIQLGDSKQLIYYWFKQRDRIITNEYLVKWYLFWDSLTKNRTDGALIRLGTSIDPGQSVEDADKLLTEFIQESHYLLKNYVPD